MKAGVSAVALAARGLNVHQLSPSDSRAVAAYLSARNLDSLDTEAARFEQIETQGTLWCLEMDEPCMTQVSRAAAIAFGVLLDERPAAVSLTYAASSKGFEPGQVGHVAEVQFTRQFVDNPAAPGALGAYCRAVMPSLLKEIANSMDLMGQQEDAEAASSSAEATRNAAHLRIMRIIRAWTQATVTQLSGGRTGAMTFMFRVAFLLRTGRITLGQIDLAKPAEEHFVLTEYVQAAQAVASKAASSSSVAAATATPIAVAGPAHTRFLSRQANPMGPKYGLTSKAKRSRQAAVSFKRSGGQSSELRAGKTPELTKA